MWELRHSLGSRSGGQMVGGTQVICKSNTSKIWEIFRGFFGFWPAEVFAFDVISYTLLSHQLMMYLFQLTFLLNILRCLVWMCCLNHQTMLRSSRQSGQEGWEVWESFGPKESHPQSRMGFQHLVRSESSSTVDRLIFMGKDTERMNLNTSMKHDEPLIEVIATTWQG